MDYEHQNDRPEARLNGPVPAAGWIKELMRQANGIWGRVEWTARARDMIANREYRYLSPAIRYLMAGGKVTMIKGAGLVHSPALHLTALAEEGEGDKPTIAAQVVAEALGLSPDASEADILDLLRGRRGRVTGATGAVAQLAELDHIAREFGQRDRPARHAAGKPDPARFVPAEPLQAVLTERNEAQAVLREQNVRARVDDAFARGWLSPAMRGWARALCMSEPDSFDLFIEKAIPPFAHLFRPATTSAAPPDLARGNHAGGAAEEIAICAQLGLKPRALRD
ncbi:phage protease [Paracoccus sp. DMF-8]|nr:phage protease [Paracoccus sp. DMF-8]MDF3606025.1 phage protease [Paracoccus sp. DMF-8]